MFSVIEFFRRVAAAAKQDQVAGPCRERRKRCPSHFMTTISTTLKKSRGFLQSAVESGSPSLTVINALSVPLLPGNMSPEYRMSRRIDSQGKDYETQTDRS